MEPLNYSELDVIVFLDNIGRTIVGALAPDQTAGTVTVYGPSILVVGQGNAPNEIGVQLIPILFPDIGKDSDGRPAVHYPEASIAKTDFVLSDDLVANYRKQLSPKSAIAMPTPQDIAATNKPAIRPLF